MNSVKKSPHPLLKSIGTVLVWITLFLPVLSISNCQNTDDGEHTYSETYYGYHLLLGIDGHVYDSNGQTNSQSFKEAWEDDSLEGITTIFYGLTLIIAGLTFWVQRTQSQQHASEELIRTGIAAVLAVSGVVVFWILELGTTMLFILYETREIGSLLIYVGFSSVMVFSLMQLRTPEQDWEPVNQSRFAQWTRYAIVLASFALSILFFGLGLFLVASILEDSLTMKHFNIVGPTVFLCFFLGITQVMLTLKLNKLFHFLPLNRVKPMLFYWATPYLIIMMLFTWIGILEGMGS